MITKNQLVRNLDVLWCALNGYAPDPKFALDINVKRKPFEKTGLIKEDLSLIPLVDYKLEAVCSRHGGWSVITSANFKPTEELYLELINAGLSREQYIRSRKYLANKSAYIHEALADK